MKDSAYRPIPKPGDDLIPPKMDKFKETIVVDAKVATRDPVALVGILAAKLACHAPDDSAVEWALGWLEGQK